ncbi:F-box protein 31 [Steccherinum ochraceum]|uniref:F-box protein 31 n=1 Tax=Steccherinum ochraceum TaxID=92696 RepID=A0A4R0RNH3_9APHY|nr:F-box protein 31 [Steccherinum ochraceum]
MKFVTTGRLGMTSRQEDYTIVPKLPVASLPFELLLHTVTFLSGLDTIHLLSTCRFYRRFVSDESIWRELCSRYGVRDLSAFRRHSGHSFYSVYTKLLHTYGPLLGIWASDNPYLGNVLEFRIVTESEEVGWEGIVGEVWKFQTSLLEVLRVPQLPDYHEFMRIELPPPSLSVDGMSPAGRNPGPSARPAWTSLYVDSDDGQSSTGTSTPSATAIRLNAPHEQAFYVCNAAPDRVKPTLHPPFPPLPVRHLWYDPARLPRLPEHTEQVVDYSVHLGSVPWDEADPFQILFATTAPPTYEPLPRSISLLPPHRDARHLENLIAPRRGSTVVDLRQHIHFFPSHFPIDRRVPRDHYYSLPSPQLPSIISPSPKDWTPRILCGLWLGAYSTDGTEVLYLKWNALFGELQAWKITGNYCVPRGAISWSFSTTMSMDPDKNVDVLLEMAVEVDSTVLSEVKMFKGTGKIADEGFIDDTEGELQLDIAVLNPNDIRIRWTYEDESRGTLAYRRYPGRDVASEVVPQVITRGVRRPRAFA